jgi:hypothetical protein
MNEKIKQLALQANSWANDQPYTGTHWDILFQDKFAELIVKECAIAFEAEVDSWKEMEPYQGSIKRQGTKAIKQHFGVEE